MGFILQLSILNLAVLVVCGVPQWLVTPGISPLLSRQVRSHKCEKGWCPNPNVPKTVTCCENIVTTTPEDDKTAQATTGTCSTATHFPCPGGTCIPTALKCNGCDECGDGADEEDCTDNSTAVAFQCPGAGGACIPKSFMCDGHNHCEDGADEQQNCPGTCPAEHFRCSNGACLPNSLKCNQINNCGDNFDEANC